MDKYVEKYVRDKTCVRMNKCERVRSSKTTIRPYSIFYRQNWWRRAQPREADAG